MTEMNEWVWSRRETFIFIRHLSFIIIWTVLLKMKLLRVFPCAGSPQSPHMNSSFVIHHLDSLAFQLTNLKVLCSVSLR